MEIGKLKGCTCIKLCWPLDRAKSDFIEITSSPAAVLPFSLKHYWNWDVRYLHIHCAQQESSIHDAYLVNA